MNAPKVMTIIETEEGFSFVTNCAEIDQTRFLEKAYKQKAEADRREMEKFKTAYLGKGASHQSHNLYHF